MTLTLKGLQVVPETTCFNEHHLAKISCEMKQCKFWANMEGYQNCINIAALNGEMTLQEIGDIFNITRMRVCQIEKSILKKILSKSPLIDQFRT